MDQQNSEGDDGRKRKMRILLIGFLILISVTAVSAGLILAIKHLFFGKEDYVSKSPETIERDPGSKTLPFANNSIHLDSPLKIGQWVHLRAHLKKDTLEFCLTFVGNSTFNSSTICSTKMNTTTTGTEPKLTFESRFNNGTVIRDRATNGLYTGLPFDVRVRILEHHLQVFVNRGEVAIFDKSDALDKVTNITLSGDIATVTVFKLKGSQYEMPFKRDLPFQIGDRIDISAHPIANVRDLSTIKALLGTDQKLEPVPEKKEEKGEKEEDSLSRLSKHHYNISAMLDNVFNTTFMEAILDTNKTQMLLDRLDHLRFKRRSSGSSRGHSSFHSSGSSHSSFHSSGSSHPSFHSSGSSYPSFHSSGSSYPSFHSSGGNTWHSSPSWHTSGSHTSGSWHSGGSTGSNYHPAYPTQNFQPHYPSYPSTTYHSTYIIPTYHGNNRGQSAARWAASPVSSSTATGAALGFAGGYSTGYMANSFVPTYSYHYMGHTYYHSSCYDCGYYSCYSCHSHYYRSRSRSSSHVDSITQSIPQSERIDITFLRGDDSWAFALSFRFSEGRFVRNTYQNGAWEEEESGDMPIDNWRIFDLSLVNSEDDIAIYFAGKRVATFKHRDASRNLLKLMIEKDAEIFSVTKNGNLVV